MNYGFAFYVRTFFVGMAMGVANIIPGVSGGTIAVVFGIYEYLMEALGNFVTNKERRKEYIMFLGVLFFGSLVAVFGLAGALSWSFKNYPLMTVYFFMGLILGSIPVVIRSHKDMKLNLRRALFLIGGAAIVVIFALFQTGKGDEIDIAYTAARFSLWDYAYFLLSGIIASSAMIVPGISGSFMLILLGIYWTVLGALDGATRLVLQIPQSGIGEELLVRIFLIGSLGIGVVLGILLFSRIMDWALKNFPSQTLYFIIGLIVGSFYQIYPGYAFNLNGLGAVATFVIGLMMALKLSATDKKAG